MNNENALRQCARPGCGEYFTPKTYNHLYCCKSCGKKERNKQRRVACGAPYTPYVAPMPAVPTQPRPADDIPIGGMHDAMFSNNTGETKAVVVDNAVPLRISVPMSMFEVSLSTTNAGEEEVLLLEVRKK